MNTAERVGLPELPTSEVEATVGETLAAARQAQGLSVVDVANRLKLSVHQVEALEQDRYEPLPGPVFVRGFIRNYARLLKLDAEAMVRAADAHLPRVAAQRTVAGETNIPMPAKNSGRWPLIAGVAAAVFLGAALVDVLWPETPTTVEVTSNRAPAPSAVAVVPQTAAQAPASSPSDASLGPRSAGESRGAAVEAVPAVSSATPQAATGAMTANYPSDASGGASTLRLVFDQESWVQVRDGSGKVVLEALFPAGASREITAPPPLALVIGNAPGVHVKYGDRMVDLVPHTRVAVARLTLQ